MGASAPRRWQDAAETSREQVALPGFHVPMRYDGQEEEEEEELEASNQFRRIAFHGSFLPSQVAVGPSLAPATMPTLIGACRELHVAHTFMIAEVVVP